jgi:Ala-tRNA(Pro) deacylase
MSVPRWIPTTLDAEHIPYRLRHHRPCFTAQEVAAAEHVSGHRLAKVVVVMADDEMVLVALPASQRLDLKAVSKTLGCASCRLATEEEIARRFPDCEVGAVPPLPHWDGVTLLADSRLTEEPGPLVFQAGTHEDAIEISSDDWKRIAHPTVGKFAASMR